MQPLLHLDQPLALFERQLGDRNAGEPRDDFGHVADVHLAGRRAAGLLPVGHLLVVLLLPLVEALLQLLGAIVILPAAGVVALALDLLQGGVRLDQVHRPRGAAQPDPRSRLVDDVDRLVGQVAPADVAVGELRRGDDRLLEDGHLVVRLEHVAQPLQDDDGLLDRRLADQHRLEAPLERGILLDVLLVLVERRRADEVQLAARQHRLERVGDVETAFAAGRAGPNDGVQLVDEEDQVVLLGGDLFEELLHPFLELAAVLGAGDQRGDDQLDDPLAAQRLGDLSRQHALGEALDDGGLPHARFADQHRVVLLAAGEDLDDRLDLLRAPDHRI